VNTIPEQIVDGRRRRRTHHPEFKADAVAACMQLGVSIAAVAQSRGVSANLLRRWVQAAESRTDQGVRAKPPRASLAHAAPAAFVPVQLPADVAAGRDIRIELRRGAMAVSVSWPTDAAAQCAVWMRELLR
jgi:transposase